MKFEWDEAKNQKNIEKHGVRFRMHAKYLRMGLPFMLLMTV